MRTQIIPEVGDRFRIVDKLYGFAFKNPSGGTGMSNWEHDEKYVGADPIVEVTKVWYDYEVGYRCIGKAINEELIKYLDKVADPKDKRVFFSEHEIQPIK